MTPKEEFLRNPDDEHKTFLDTEDGLDEAHLTEVWLGTRSIREIAAHLSNWHRKTGTTSTRTGNSVALRFQPDKWGVRGSPMRLTLVLSMVFILVLFIGFAYAQAQYDNPVDGRSYVTEGEFKTYTPEKPRDTTWQKVVTNSIHLLTGEPDLKKRVRVEDLASFIKSAETKAYPILAKNQTPALILLQFDSQPNEHDVKIASQGNPQESILQELYDAMKELTPLRTTGEVMFQVEIHVRP